MAEDPWLTYKGAAKRLQCTVRTIQYMRAAGMVMGTDELGRRIVRESVLLEFHRRRLDANPAHQYRLRKLKFDTPVDGWS